ncbi:MAG: hypothetical protein AB7F40_10810 [Victivallaceae bacterium]|nr:hypothetical protein [Victivallaceae bacterium]
MNTAKTICPHCGETTAPRTRLKNPDDFNSPRITVCMFCGGELPAATTGKEPAATATRAENSALAGLLGGDEREKRFELRNFSADRRFCRDCSEFIPHPFGSRCGKTGRPADPMADCPDYTPKPAEEKPDDPE